MIGLPNGRMLCKTCGKRFTFARDLITHILAARLADEHAVDRPPTGTGLRSKVTP